MDADAQDSPRETTAARKGPADVVDAERDGRRLSARQTGAPQTGAPQTGAPQTEARQTGARQTGARQTGARQTGTRQTGTWQTGAWGLLILLTLVVRTAALLTFGPQFQQDPDAYANLARGIRERGVLGFVHDGQVTRPTALRPPLYPLLLAPTIVSGQPFPPAVGLLHVLLGTVTVVLVERLGAAWQLGRWRWLAAGLTACDPLLLNQSALIMSETLATFLAAACLLALTGLRRQPGPSAAGLSGAGLSGAGLSGAGLPPAGLSELSRAGLSGLLLGLAVLCRPTFAPWAGVALVACLVLPGSALLRGSRAAVLLAGLVLVLLPWGLRNQVYLGKPIVTTTHGGYTLLLGNNPHFYQHLRSAPAGRRWDAEQLHRGYRDAAHRRVTWDPHPAVEIQRDRLDSQLAWQAIRRQPAMFGLAAAVRLGRLWSPLPLQRSPDESTGRRLLRYATAMWYVSVYGLCLVGLVSLGRNRLRLPWLWGLSLCLVFSAVHFFYWSDLRMRGPLIPVTSLLAAAGASGLVAITKKASRVS